MTDKSPMGDMALNKAMSKWATHNTPPRELSAFVDGFAAASAPLLARIEEFKTQEHYTLNVCGGVIEDLIRVSVSIGLSDEYTDADAIIAEIEKLKAQVAAENGKINVLVDILRDVLMPLSVSKIDAMTSGEEDDYRMIAELEKRIKAAIHGATP